MSVKVMLVVCINVNNQNTDIMKDIKYRYLGFGIDNVWSVLNLINIHTCSMYKKIKKKSVLLARLSNFMSLATNYI